MKCEYLSNFKKSFIFTTLLFAIAGCGSSSPNTDNGTGSITAKLVWSPSSGLSQAKTTEKTLYAAPTGVAKIKFIVYYGGTFTIDKTFDVIPNVAGNGQIDGIPAGTGRRVVAIGKSAAGLNIYQGEKSNITIIAGQVTDIGTITMAPITTASRAGATYPMPFDLTLTSSVPATIYYTTNGADPATSSLRGEGTNPTFSIYSSPTTVKFFSFINYSAREATKTEIYRKP